MKKNWADRVASGCLILIMAYAGVMFSWILAWFLSSELSKPWNSSEDILDALWHVNLQTFAPLFGTITLGLTGLTYFGIRLYDRRHGLDAQNPQKTKGK